MLKNIFFFDILFIILLDHLDKQYQEKEGKLLYVEFDCFEKDCKKIIVNNELIKEVLGLDIQRSMNRYFNYPYL